MRDLRLFGSKVRGDDHDESDIDVLVLIEGCDYQTSADIGVLARSISSWLSPLASDFDAYHRPSSRASGFYQEMRNESVRL
ncbi:MAG: nucleotidyltransferase domain-containing protein [Acidimicrobiales bacterium]